MSQPEKAWNVFISHASEDKDAFVRPLALALRNLGIRVWYDEFSLEVGDSLSRSIDKGLAESSYGIVIISPHFISKPWPERELSGLVAREISEGRVILPIWHGVTKSDVLKFSPPLADKIALNSSELKAEDIAIQLLREIRPDLYEKHPRAELECLANGEVLRELQDEIERARRELEEARAELSEYHCPYCGSSLAERIDAPADEEQKHWDVREIFGCGFQRFGGSIERPCPSDPLFPKFEEYELIFRESPEESHFNWRCHALGKTTMARKVSISTGYGRTKEEAEKQVREHYDRIARRR